MIIAPDSYVSQRSNFEDVWRKCSCPIKVTGPDGNPIWVRCHSRRKAKCEQCAQEYQMDSRKILYSGIELAEDAENFRYVMMTLTSPSFGDVHRVPKHGRSKIRCKCGVYHDAEKGKYLRGIPVTPSEYDYDGVVDWNYHLGELWNATRTRMRDVWGDFDYIKVAEWQTRGSLHLHVILKFPVAQYLTMSRMARQQGITLEEWARTVVLSAHVKNTYRWGDKAFDWQVIGTEDGVKKSVRYVAKALAYVAKDVVVDCFETARGLLKHHVILLDRAAQRMRCDHCNGSGYCRSLCHRRWGARSCTMSKSRPTATKAGWSALRRMDLKQRRCDYAVKKQREEFAEKVLDAFLTRKVTEDGSQGFAGWISSTEDVTESHEFANQLWRDWSGTDLE